MNCSSITPVLVAAKESVMGGIHATNSDYMPLERRRAKRISVPIRETMIEPMQPRRVE